MTFHLLTGKNGQHYAQVRPAAVFGQPLINLRLINFLLTSHIIFSMSPRCQENFTTTTATAGIMEIGLSAHRTSDCRDSFRSGIRCPLFGSSWNKEARWLILKEPDAYCAIANRLRVRPPMNMHAAPQPFILAENLPGNWGARERFSTLMSARS